MKCERTRPLIFNECQHDPMVGTNYNSYVSQELDFFMNVRLTQCDPDLQTIVFHVNVAEITLYFSLICCPDG